MPERKRKENKYSLSKIKETLKIQNPQLNNSLCIFCCLRTTNAVFVHKKTGHRVSKYLQLNYVLYGSRLVLRWGGVSFLHFLLFKYNVKVIWQECWG